MISVNVFCFTIFNDNFNGDNYFNMDVKFMSN